MNKKGQLIIGFGIVAGLPIATAYSLHKTIHFIVDYIKK
jgi:hypothetical protein